MSICITISSYRITPKERRGAHKPFELLGGGAHLSGALIKYLEQVIKKEIITKSTLCFLSIKIVQKFTCF